MCGRRIQAVHRCSETREQSLDSAMVNLTAKYRVDVIGCRGQFGDCAIHNEAILAEG